jgi:ammonium transporter, Amt family
MTIDSGDTAWVLLSTLLVFSMSTPGLAIYFGGMAQKKNVVSTVIQCTAVSGIVTLAFLLFGYSLSMSPDHGNRAYDEVNFNPDPQQHNILLKNSNPITADY